MQRSVRAALDGVREQLGFRLPAHNAEKDVLAREALRYLTPGMPVMLDDSTAALALARPLPDVGPTGRGQRLPAGAGDGVRRPDIRLIGLGGECSRTYDSCLGPPCREVVNTPSADIAFLSISAMGTSLTYHSVAPRAPLRASIPGSSSRPANVLLLPRR